MKIVLGIIMAFALVMTTSFPAMAQAKMLQDGAKAQQVKVQEAGDCHQHAKAQQSKESSGKCCDTSMCKCVGSACYNVMSKTFSDSSHSLLLSLTSSKGSFAFTHDVVESAPSNPLKRPPKA